VDPGPHSGKSCAFQNPYGHKRVQQCPIVTFLRQPFTIFLPMQKLECVCVCVCVTVQYVKGSQLEQCALNQQQPESFLHEKCTAVQASLTCACIERGERGSVRGRICLLFE